MSIHKFEINIDDMKDYENWRIFKLLKNEVNSVKYVYYFECMYNEICKTLPINPDQEFDVHIKVPRDKVGILKNKIRDFDRLRWLGRRYYFDRQQYSMSVSSKDNEIILKFRFNKSPKTTAVAKIELEGWVATGGQLRMKHKGDITQPGTKVQLQCKLRLINLHEHRKSTRVFDVDIENDNLIDRDGNIVQLVNHKQFFEALRESLE